MRSSYSVDDLNPGDVICAGGQIGEFRKLIGKGKRKTVCYRPYGCLDTRTRLPHPATMGRLVPEIRVEREHEWCEVTQ